MGKQSHKSQFRNLLPKINVNCSTAVNDVLQNHSLLFQETLGNLVGMKATVVVPSDALPQFFKPRPMLIALELELDHLWNEGVISPLLWAVPIVPILKHDCSVCCIFGDYKVTVNGVDAHPLSRVRDLFIALTTLLVMW